MFEYELLLQARWRLDLVLGGNAVHFRTMYFLWSFPPLFAKFAPKIFFANIALLARACADNNFRVRTLGVWRSCSVGVFWCCFAYIFALLCGFVLAKVV